VALSKRIRCRLAVTDCLDGQPTRCNLAFAPLPGSLVVCGTATGAAEDLRRAAPRAEMRRGTNGNSFLLCLLCRLALDHRAALGQHTPRFVDEGLHLGPALLRRHRFQLLAL
jgi:hypothetical protein